MASDDLYGPSNRELRVQDRLDKRRKKKIERRDKRASRTPLFKKDGKNCDDQGCWDPNNSDAPSANRKKRRRPPIPKPGREIISNKVVTDRTAESKTTEGEGHKDALDIEYHRTPTQKTKKNREEWTDEDGTKHWKETTAPTGELKDDAANVVIEGGKVVSKEGELTDEQKEKIEKYKKESADAELDRSYKPKTKDEGYSKERTALKAKRRGKGYKPLSSYQSSERKYSVSDAPWQAESDKTLSTTNRRGKSKIYDLSKRQKYDLEAKGHRTKATAAITKIKRSGKVKTREVDADRLESKMGRVEDRAEKRVKRQGDRFKVRRDPDKMERYRDAVKASRQTFRDNRRADKGKKPVEVAKAQRETKRARKKSEKISDREYRQKLRKTTTFKQRRRMKSNSPSFRS